KIISIFSISGNELVTQLASFDFIDFHRNSIRQRYDIFTFSQNSYNFASPCTVQACSSIDADLHRAGRSNVS
ncbi:hypothetical protein, partial [Bergeyella sp. RCAD1439]|uniref:hypothetical protein n=1 Tax=Bergeyella anatis TaxID=3113737 RepID=UPI002E18A5E0|nr:hypothetical protein [Bergeyella sp. RCAD1439]